MQRMLAEAAVVWVGVSIPAAFIMGALLRRASTLQLQAAVVDLRNRRAA
jgi:hypothetical protein